MDRIAEKVAMRMLAPTRVCQTSTIIFGDPKKWRIFKTVDDITEDECWEVFAPKKVHQPEIRAHTFEEARRGMIISMHANEFDQKMRRHLSRDL